jgi:nitrate/nitrite transporter NarK
MEIGRPIILLGCVGAGLAIALFALKNPLAPWFAVFFAGFFSAAVYAIGYLFPVKMPKIGKKYAPISIGLINAAGILGGAVSTSAFPAMATAIGYESTWLLLGIFSMLFVPLIYLAREPYRIQAEPTEKTTDALR